MRWNRFIAQPLRHAIRLLLRHPGTSLLAIFALSSGIALTATMLSLIDGFLLRDLPLPSGDRYMVVYSAGPASNIPPFQMSLHDYRDLRTTQNSFQSFVAYIMKSFDLSDDSGFPERRDGCLVHPDFFSAASYEPYLGRGLYPEDALPGAKRVAVIGYDLWQHRLGGDPAVLGQMIRLEGKSTQIVGVMPPGFRLPTRHEIWMPLSLEANRFERDQGPSVRVFGQLKKEIGRRQATAELRAIAARLAAQYPETHRGRSVVVTPYTQHFMWAELRQSLWVLLSLVGLGLLIACANVASLILARTVHRLHEIATLSALGASRGQVMAHVLSESLVLAGAGTLGGLLLAHWGVGLVADQMASMPLPFWMGATLNLKVLGWAVATSFFAASLAGLYPAFRATRPEITSFLHTRAASGLKIGRFVRTLLIGTVSFAFILLVLTGLFLRTTFNLNRLDIGVDIDQVMTARLAFPDAGYPEPVERIALIDALVARMNERPGVRAGAASSLPASGFGNLAYYGIEGEVYATPAEHPRTHRLAVTPEFFDLFQIPVLMGRLIGPQDRLESRPVAVVNRSFAERSWPGLDPIGRRLRLGRGEPGQPLRTVVGVVPDFWPGTLDESDQTAVYVPHAQTGDLSLWIAVATVGDIRSLTAMLREETRTLDRSLPLFEARTMREVLDIEMFHSRLFAQMVMLLGFVSMLFAAVGIYGVNAFAVSQKTPEIGLRIAMGAKRREIIGLILRQGLGRTAIGLAIGLIVGAVTTPRMAWILFEVEPWDFLTFAGTALFLAAIALFACFGPANRAARVNPIEALRDE